MKRTLLELWNTNLGELRTRTESKAQYDEVLTLIDKHHKRLEELLNDEGKTVLEKFEDCYGEMESIECENAFIRGFCLGAKLMIEVLSEA